MKSARRCTLCFHLSRDLGEKHGQIAHIDKDPSNPSEDNLAFMCLPHHSLFDSKTSQHKNYTQNEVKSARAVLYEAIASHKHAGPQPRCIGLDAIALASHAADDDPIEGTLITLPALSAHFPPIAPKRSDTRLCYQHPQRST